MPRTKKAKTGQEIPVHKPPLKWAGAKTRLVTRILSLLPKGTTRLIEPFAGSAVVSLNAQVPKFILADINKDLINLYKIIRDDSPGLIQMLEGLFVPANNVRERYDEYRAKFNTRALSPLENAAIFVYLNRHAFNGLCRYNGRGEFNVPFGAIANPFLPADAIRHAGSVLGRAELIEGSFETVIAKAEKGDFVYCDPPYVPLSLSASFTQYATTDFRKEQQEALVKAALEAADRGAIVAISNHDTAETRLLYANANRVYSFPVSRTISSKGANRKSVLELIAVYKPSRRFV